MKLKLSELIPPSFFEDYKSILRHEGDEWVEIGGRGSCKSSFLSLMVTILIIQNPSFNVLIVRKVKETLKDSVYNQMLWAISKLGVDDLFKPTLSPLQIKYKPTGQIIYFRGADDPLKIKSIKPVKGYIAITWLEEWSEFTQNDTSTILISANRGGSKYYNFFSFNPPSSERNWVNTEVRQYKKNRRVTKTNYTQVPAEWLGEKFLADAEDLKQRNRRAYDNIYLGEPTGTGLNIFENVEVRKITDNERFGFEWNYYGVDWGYFPDPFRFVAVSYSIKTNILYIWAELSLQKTRNQDAAEILKEFMKAHKIPEDARIVADSAEPKSVADFREFGLNCRGAIKGTGSRDTSFKWLQGLKKIIIDPETAPGAADEFSLYEHEIDKRTGEIINNYPDGQPDHSVDATRYALEEIWTKRGL